MNSTLVLCTRCAFRWVKAPESIEVDPICDPCARDLAARADLKTPTPTRCRSCGKIAEVVTRAEGFCKDCETDLVDCMIIGATDLFPEDASYDIDRSGWAGDGYDAF